jgi:hypothetical protein
MRSRNHQSGCGNRGDGDFDAKTKHNRKSLTENRGR